MHALRWFKRALLAVVVLAIAWQAVYFVQVVWWRFFDPGITRFMDIRLNELREKNPRALLVQQWVPYGKVSREVKRAIVAAEDAKFVDHEGFDWDGIQKAIEKNQKRGRVVAGGSTISQQLAKNLFLSPAKTPWRKAEEALITLMLEAVLDKRRILEIYLNVIEWGNGVFGVEAAAQHYFGVGAHQLSAYQAAWLAAVVPNPRFYDRNRSAPGVLRKTEIILGRMPGAAIP